MSAFLNDGSHVFLQLNNKQKKSGESVNVDPSGGCLTNADWQSLMGELQGKPWPSRPRHIILQSMKTAVDSVNLTPPIPASPFEYTLLLIYLLF